MWLVNQSTRKFMETFFVQPQSQNGETGFIPTEFMALHEWCSTNTERVMPVLKPADKQVRCSLRKWTKIKKNRLLKTHCSVNNVEGVTWEFRSDMGPRAFMGQPHGNFGRGRSTDNLPYISPDPKKNQRGETPVKSDDSVRRGKNARNVFAATFSFYRG